MYGRTADDMEEDLLESPVRRTTKSRHVTDSVTPLLKHILVNATMLILSCNATCINTKHTAFPKFDGNAGGKLFLRRLQMERSAASALLHSAPKLLTLRCACFLVYSCAHCNFN